MNAYEGSTKQLRVLHQLNEALVFPKGQHLELGRRESEVRDLSERIIGERTTRILELPRRVLEAIVRGTPIRKRVINRDVYPIKLTNTKTDPEVIGSILHESGIIGPQPDQPGYGLIVVRLFLANASITFHDGTPTPDLRVKVYREQGSYGINPPQKRRKDYRLLGGVLPKRADFRSQLPTDVFL